MIDIFFQVLTSCKFFVYIYFCIKKFSFAVVEVLDNWHLLFPFSRFYHWCHLRKKIIVFTYLLHTYINQNLSAMTIVNSFTTMWYTLGDILVLTKMREFLQSYKKPKLLWNWLLDTIVNYSNLQHITSILSLLYFWPWLLWTPLLQCGILWVTSWS